MSQIAWERVKGDTLTDSMVGSFLARFRFCSVVDDCEDDMDSCELGNCDGVEGVVGTFSAPTEKHFLSDGCNSKMAPNCFKAYQLNLMN